MTYQMAFEQVLLPEWEGWDGSGVYTIPGKNVTLLDGTEGSVLIDSQGIVLYNQPLDILNDGENDMGMSFIEMSEKAEEVENFLSPFLSKQDMEESKIVFQKYLERDASYIS